MFSFCDERFGLDCGVDEAGRGPWAGPVVAAAVILPKNFSMDEINDSKKLSKKNRNRFFEVITSTSDFKLATDRLRARKGAGSRVYLSISSTDP